jgi:hypothetical protein
LVENAHDDVQRLVGRLTPSLGFYAVILLLALVAPSVAAFGFLAIGLRAVLNA